MKRLSIILLIAIAGFTSCQKEGPKGETGESGPDAKMYSYTVNFSSGQTYQEYTGIVGSFDSGDIVVTYVEDPNEDNLTGLWVQTPFINNDGVNFYAEVTDNGTVYFNTVIAADGSSPWTSNHYFNCRSVLIKGTGLAKHPDLDIADYDQVREAFDL